MYIDKNKISIIQSSSFIFFETIVSVPIKKINWTIFIITNNIQWITV